MTHGETSKSPLLTNRPSRTEKSNKYNYCGIPDAEDENGMARGLPTRAKLWLLGIARKIGYRHIKTFTLMVMLIVPAIAFSTQEEQGESLEHPIIRGLRPDTMARIEIDEDFEYRYLDVTMTLEDLPDQNMNITVDVVNTENEIVDTWNIFHGVDAAWVSSFAEHKLFKLNESVGAAAGFAFEVQVNDNGENTDRIIGMTFAFNGVSPAVDYEVWFAAFILIFVYILIIFELIHRTLAAMLGSFLALGVLSALNKRPSLEVVVEWIDFETIMLLFGMMVIVGVLSETGVFEWCAVKAYKMSSGNTWSLITLLCVFTAVVSAFLDNVTTILLLTPVTIRMCNVIGLEPATILMAEVFFSNIGGAGTAVGDPPNVIIVSSNWLEVPGNEKDILFTEFTGHLLPGVIVACFVCFLQMKWMLRKTDLNNPDNPATAEIKREILIWERTLSKQACRTKEERRFCAKLERKIEELRVSADDAMVNESHDWAQTVKDMEVDAQIKDFDLLVNSGIVLTGVILMFFLAAHPAVHLDLGWIAVLGAMALLLISGIHNIEELMMKVEWATLLFFAALFILMEALTEFGLIDWIGEGVSGMIRNFPVEQRQAYSIILVLWVSALSSSFIDNIPFTTAMIPVIKRIASDPQLIAEGLQLRPLVWSLAFGACLGGNGTLIGASANVVMAGLAEQEGISITFNAFFKRGFPIMLMSTFVAMLYLLICHVAFDWNQ